MCVTMEVAARDLVPAHAPSPPDCATLQDVLNEETEINISFVFLKSKK